MANVWHFGTGSSLQLRGSKKYKFAAFWYPTFVTMQHSISSRRNKNIDLIQLYTPHTYDDVPTQRKPAGRLNLRLGEETSQSYLGRRSQTTIGTLHVLFCMV